MDRRHYEGLDALRGLAAFLVVGHHIVLTSGLQVPMLVHGYLSVDLFFMLSGFVIGRAYEARLRDPSYARIKYVETRLVRLYPMVLLGVLVGAVVALSHPAAAPTSPVVRCVLHVLLIPSLYTAGALFVLNPPHWSLFFELVVNFSHAALAPLLSTRRLAFLVGLCAIAFGLVAVTSSASVGFDRHTFIGGFPRVGFGFFSGVLLYRLSASDRLPRVRRLAWVSLPAFAAAIGLVGWFDRGDIVLVLFGLPLIVWFGAEMNLGQRGRAIARRAGELSYPVYSVHLPLVVALGKVLSPFPLRQQEGAWIVFALMLWPACAVIERYYDRPVRAMLSERLALWRSRVQATTAI